MQHNKLHSCRRAEQVKSEEGGDGSDTADASAEVKAATCKQ